MKLVKNYLVVFLIINLFFFIYPIQSNKLSHLNSFISEEKETLNKISLQSNTDSNNLLKTITNSTNSQVVVNTIRTHHYEEAEEAPPGSIMFRGPIATSKQIITTPPAAVMPSIVKVSNPLLNQSRIVTSNEWKIPFPVIKPGQNPEVNVFMNKPYLGSPPGSIGISRPLETINFPRIPNGPVSISPLNIGGITSSPVPIIKSAYSPVPIAPVNIGGVPPTSVPILKPGFSPMPISKPIGITRSLRLQDNINAFNTNFVGNIDSIDDLKISSNFKYISFDQNKNNQYNISKHESYYFIILIIFNNMISFK